MNRALPEHVSSCMASSMANGLRIASDEDSCILVIGAVLGEFAHILGPERAVAGTLPSGDSQSEGDEGKAEELQAVPIHIHKLVDQHGIWQSAHQYSVEHYVYAKRPRSSGCHVRVEVGIGKQV